MNQRKILLFSAVIFSLLMIAGFISKFYRENYRVIHLSIATGSKSGEAYPFAQALQQVLLTHYPQIKLKLIESNGSGENMQLLEQKKVELAIVQADTTAPASVRAVTILYPEVFHLIVTEKSGIKNVWDLKGKRIALMPKGSGSYDAFWVLAKHYNLKPRDFKYIMLNPEQALLAFRQNKVDAVVRNLPIGNRWTQQLMATSQTRMVGIDQAAAIRIFLPYFTEAIVPKGTYQASPPVPDRNLPVVGVEAALVSHQDVDPQIIRKLTQIIYDRRHDLVKIQPKAAGIKKPDVGQSLSLPIHPGARAYYNRETPDFFSSNANLLSLIVSIISLLASSFWSWKSQLLEKQKNRVDIYNLQILDIIDKARHTWDRPELENLQQQLFKVLRQVIEDLDLDRIDSESFQSFTFTWEMAINTIRHQEIIVLSLPAESTLCQ